MSVARALQVVSLPADADLNFVFSMRDQTVAIVHDAQLDIADIKLFEFVFGNDLVRL